MIHRLIDASLNNRFLIVMLWGLALGVGLYAMRTLPIDAVPDVTNVQVQVLTNSPGLAPEEVERYITFPVETSLSGIPNVEEIRSISKFGLSVVTVVFAEGTDIYWARQQVGERLTAAKAQIPSGYGEPQMGPISTGLGEIFQFEVKGPGYTPMERRTILDWIIAYQLKSVPGIVEVNSFGGELKCYQISLDPREMRKHEITLHAVFQALRENNRNVGGAYIVRNSEQWLIRGEGLIEGKKDLETIVIQRSQRGSPLTLGHIARVELAPMVRQGAVTRDGRGEAVIGIVMMLAGANGRVVVERVKKRIAAVEKTLPKGVTIEPFYDRTELIDKTIATVATNLLEGGALVVLVLFLLLGNIRAGLIVALAIPLSMLVALVALERMGYSGNLMSLGAIDFGLIVDGSVVIVENIVRYLHEHRDDRQTPLLEKVRAASHEVGRPVVFAVLIIVIVYPPIIALSGIEGKLFKPMAFTVVWALVASLLLSLTLMPVLASLVLRGRVSERETPVIRLARWLFRPLQRVTMRLRVVTVVVTL
ncbi:MAG: efflux RND transporter permease subunit, partial [Myxococcales bacterium]|nr:efflux RND transporter permease subunit [Myxococcales bacterium]